MCTEHGLNTIGRHLIAELYGCEPARLDDVAQVERAMREAATVVGATIMNAAFHHYAPQGVSGVLLIAESHLSVHTWPEAAYAAIDIFTCGGLDPRPGFAHVGDVLGASQCRVQEIVRGLAADIDAQRPLLPADVQLISRAELLPLPGTDPKA